jgi:glutathione S-transferase
MDLSVATTRVGAEIVLSLTGIADLSTLPLLQDRLRRAFADHPGNTIVVDLDGLLALDDTALGLFLGASAQARQAGGQLAIVCSNDRLRRRLSMTGLDQLVTVRSTISTDPPSIDSYVAVIFTSQRTGLDDEGYRQATLRMAELSARQPGFRGIESVRDGDGVGITVSYWDTEQDARAWKRNPEHLVIQQTGRHRWYDWYRTRIATVSREYSHQRPMFHMALPADWEAAERAGDYRISTRGVTLEQEGFIHCSFEDQVVGVANRFYADIDEVVLLHVDPSKLTAEVRHEAPAPGIPEVFPHVYGPIALSAVVATIRWERGDDGWHLPPAIYSA